MTKAKPPEEHDERGRPTEYHEKYNDMARKFCLLTNATDKKLADFFGIAESTINAWKIAHPDFAESIKAGKLGADMDVVEATARSTMGYTVELIERDISPTDGKTVIAMRVRQQHIPASPQAQRLWLMNRHGEHWREKMTLAHTGPNGTGPVLTGQISDEDAAKAYLDMLNSGGAAAATAKEEDTE